MSKAPLTSPAHILLLGFGKMGAALWRGWQTALPHTVFTIIEPEAALHLPQQARTEFFVSLQHMPPAAKPAIDVVLLAVKPQSLPQILPQLASFVGQSLFVSIAAGRSLSFIEQGLGSGNAAIVRTMPNLPLAVGAGAVVAVANQQVSELQKQQAEALFAPLGLFAYTDNEALLDAVTALSGSGPAYVFLLVEAMRDAGIKLGLPADLAANLATATLMGSAKMLAESATLPEDLRAAVTSPAGTTAAALAQLMPALPDLLFKAMQAAQQRAIELAEG